MSGSECATNGDTCVCTGNRSVLEERCSRFTGIRTKKRCIVTRAGNDFQTVLVVVCTVVKNVHVQRNLADVSSRDVDGRHSHSSTLSRTHVVSVSTVVANVVVSLHSFRRIEGWVVHCVVSSVVSTPVVVRVVCIVTCWGDIFDVFPIETELKRLGFIVTRI